MEKRLLVIDDDDAIRDVIREIFEQDGYQVHCLPDVDHIFSEINFFHPSVVLVNYMLGFNNGAEIAHEIKSNAGTAHVPIVLFSAHHQRVNEMGNYGWDAFVGKPFDIDDIKQVVGRFVKAKDS